MTTTLTTTYRQATPHISPLEAFVIRVSFLPHMGHYMSFKRKNLPNTPFHRGITMDTEPKAFAWQVGIIMPRKMNL
jgi:hypothetical protein